MLTQASARANADRTEKIPRLTVQGLRHTIAAISLDRHGHLSKNDLAPLMAKIDGLSAPIATPEMLGKAA